MEKNKHFGLTDSLIEAVKSCLSKEELVGNQKKLDVNKNGKLDAEDFKKLRGEGKMGKMAKEEDDEEEEDDEGVESSDDEKKKENAKMRLTKEGTGTLKPGWMLKKDPKLATIMKAKIDLAKKRQATYGNPAAGKSLKEEDELGEAFIAPALSAANANAEYARQPKDSNSLKVAVKHVGGASDYKSIKAHLASKGIKADVGTGDGFKTAHLSNLSHSPSDVKKKLGIKEGQIDEAFPTVADTMKRDPENSTFDKKKISTGTVYTKKYKDKEKEEKDSKSEMDEAKDPSDLKDYADKENKGHHWRPTGKVAKNFATKRTTYEYERIDTEGNKTGDRHYKDSRGKYMGEAYESKDAPFDGPYAKKKIAVPGKNGIGPSTAKHLAKMAMAKQIKKLNK